MFSKNNRLMNDQRKGEKITRYSIKKYSFGAASVAVAFGIYFANGPVVSAQELSNSSNLVSTSQVPAKLQSQALRSWRLQVKHQNHLAKQTNKVRRVRPVKKRHRRFQTQHSLK